MTLKLIELLVYHRGCCLCEFFNSKCTLASIPLIQRENESRVQFVLMPDPSLSADDVKRRLSEYPDVIECYIISKRPSPALFVRKHSHGILNAIVYAKGTLIPPIIVRRNGVKRFHVLPSNRRSLARIQEKLREDKAAEAKTLRTHIVPTKNLAEAYVKLVLGSLAPHLFTPRELEVVGEYLLWKSQLRGSRPGPTKKRIAEIMGISRPTLVQHIERVQEKLLRLLLERGF